MIERRQLRFPAPALDGIELPLFEARGSRDGPRVCLLAGVHGCEYASIEALTRFMRQLDSSALCGSVIAAPIVNMPAFRARSPFVTPGDGKNLNRCFPGDPGGTVSDVLAHHVFTELIEPADALIDLHGGDLVEALEPFTLYDEGPCRSGRTSWRSRSDCGT
jgi:predicted deacylase